MVRKTNRRLKLQPDASPRAHKSRIVPSLKLSGVWLEKIGFSPGDLVEVTTREKLLIIQPVCQGQEETAQYKEQLHKVKQQLKKLL